ncbi:hypothetical protein Tco_0291061 [Tanacetum coccineum]
MLFLQQRNRKILRKEDSSQNRSGTRRQTIWKDDYKAKVDMEESRRMKFRCKFATKRGLVAIGYAQEEARRVRCSRYPEKVTFEDGKLCYGFKACSRDWNDELPTLMSKAFLMEHSASSNAIVLVSKNDQTQSTSRENALLEDTVLGDNLVKLDGKDTNALQCLHHS